MNGPKNTPIGCIFSYTYKALETTLYGAVPATHARYWKCSCRGQFQQLIQSTANAPIRRISSYTYKALEIPL
jgi:hypothetical protein